VTAFPFTTRLTSIKVSSLRRRNELMEPFAQKEF